MWKDASPRCVVYFVLFYFHTTEPALAYYGELCPLFFVGIQTTHFHSTRAFASLVPAGARPTFAECFSRLNDYLI